MTEREWYNDEQMIEAWSLDPLQILISEEEELS